MSIYYFFIQKLNKIREYLLYFINCGFFSFGLNIIFLLVWPQFQCIHSTFTVYSIKNHDFGIIEDKYNNNSFVELLSLL